MKAVRTRASRARRGVAIIMVMVVLSGLVALAAPFVLSMLLQSRSARSDLTEAQARAGAEAAVDHAIAQLHRLVKMPGYDPTPDVDTLDELKIDWTMPGVDVKVQDPNGLLWSAKVEDEQGKINIQTAPPALIGNLLNATTLSERTDKGAGVLIVDDGSAFWDDGDPGTVDGFVRIGSDTVAYTSVQGNTVVLAPQGDYALLNNHNQGALVYDGRAAWIADYKFRPGSNEFRPFRSIYEIKSAGGGNPALAVRPDEFARVERFLTIDSGLEGPLWGRAERISEQSFEGDRQWFTVENGSGFGPGAFVRFIQNGRTVTHVRIDAVRVQQRTGWTVFHTELPVGVSVNGSGVGNDVFVSPMLYHPINLNTASPDVVYACVLGVALAGSTEPVKSGTARLLAAHLTERTYANSDDIYKALDEACRKGILTAPQRDAVYINATEYNSPKLRSSTVPFCYRGYGSFTVEGTGIVNSGNGLQLARHTIRQVVTLPSPPPGRFKLETQEQFQKLVDQGMGARVVTWPIAMPPTGGKYRRSTIARQPDPNRGDVRLSVGECGPHGVPGEWIDHCDDPNQRCYVQEGYDYQQHGKFVTPGVPGPNGYMPTTGCELWVKPNGGGQMFFYDQGEDSERNRVSFYYQPGEGLVVRIFDAGLEGNFSQFTYPAQLDGNTWHHVAASWRSGYIQGQEVRLDGQLLPSKNGDVKFTPGTRLSGDIKEDDTELDLDDGSDLPIRGAIKIGEEIIEFERSGNSLKNLVRGSRMSTAAAHLQGEYVMLYGYACPLAGDLPVGGGLLAERIEKPNSGGLLTTRVNHPAPPNKVDFVAHDETAKLPVLDATDFPPSGYVIVSGEVIYYSKRSATALEGLERAQTASGNSGKARNLKHNSQVHLISFEVNKHDQYENSGVVQIDNEDDDTVVEWIAYGEKKTTDGKRYLIARTGSNGPATIQQGDPPTTLNNERSVYVSEFRGRMGTSPAMAHEKKAKVIPVVRMSGPQNGHALSPFGAGISNVSVLTRGQADGDVRWVKRAFTHQFPNWNIRYDNTGKAVSATFAGWGFEYWAGLNDFVSRRYNANVSRFLKFPSGELPDVSDTQRHVGESMDGESPISGWVDEIKVVPLQSLGGKIAMDLAGTVLKAGDGDVLIETVDAWPRPGNSQYNPNWPQNGGIIKIEDELISYTSAGNASVQYYADVLPTRKLKAERQAKNPVTGGMEDHANIHSKTVVRLSGLQRGVLGTSAADHPPGAHVMLHDAAPISTLVGAMSATNDAFHVKDARGFPQEGYAWIGGEVLSWTKRQNLNFTGCQYFRGRFGTGPEGHMDGEVVQAIPFRYWDRAPVEYDGDGIAYFQAGYHCEGAIWETVELSALAGAGSMLPNYCKPRILARFDRQPGWDSVPTGREGGLYEFGGQGSFTLRGTAPGGGVKANQIEIRVYWQYFPGAWLTSSDWKRTFALDRLRATYRSPLVFRRRDEIEKR
ncbi:MAG: general secretion pathway protein GspK [Planctomycetota bacterium]|nr:general secretion pathway protein GspK [Planctomycetota bacterium]